VWPLAAIEARSGFFGAPIEKHTEGRSATLKGRVGDGPSIKLTANRGWISVRKEGTQPSELLPDGPGDGGPHPPMPPKAPKPPKDLEGAGSRRFQRPP
jgi:hypothetical protein